MLIFLDESGDNSQKGPKKSSAFFVVTLVIFIGKGEAQACDTRIDVLRSELKLPKDYEFHFSRNTKRVKLAFFEAVSKYNFSIFTVAIDKSPDKFYGQQYKSKSEFYKYACNLVLTLALPYFDNATLVFDKVGSKSFQTELKKFIKSHSNFSKDKIADVKCQDSHKNNLLQLVDYCVSLENRILQGKKDADQYKKFISNKEVIKEIFPK